MFICSLSFTINCNEVPLSSDVNGAKSWSCYLDKQKTLKKSIFPLKIIVF